MNNTQLKYARERLAQAKRDKEDKLPRRWGYTNEERDQLFKEGRYRVVGNKGSYSIEWHGEGELKEAHNLERTKLEKEYRRILDELVLGDDEYALTLINKFIGE